ncbi:hypothetical protein, partial [Stenotrophomonas maltophilia]|uniref:hypothetical protein n=2 Tax=Stenotrophomonas maltophilia TaxID=40324 RepID=UPI00195546C3
KAAVIPNITSRAEGVIRASSIAAFQKPARSDRRLVFCTKKAPRGASKDMNCSYAISFCQHALLRALHADPFFIEPFVQRRQASCPRWMLTGAVLDAQSKGLDWDSIPTFVNFYLDPRYVLGS